MIKVPFYEIKESILPAKRWKLNEKGNWRPFSRSDMGKDELELIRGTNYEIYKSFPLKLELPAYFEVDYETNFSGIIDYFKLLLYLSCRIEFLG